MEECLFCHGLYMAFRDPQALSSTYLHYTSRPSNSGLMGLTVYAWFQLQLDQLS